MAKKTPQTPTPGIAFAYCRQSDTGNNKRSSDDRDTLSLEAQLAACRQHAKRIGVPIAAVYSEQYTGTTDDRPRYQQMLADIKSNHRNHPVGDPARVTTIIIYKYLRLSRDPNYLVPVLGVLRSQGIEVEPSSEQKIGATPLDELMAYALATFGKIQVSDSAAHAAAARKQLEDAGLLVCAGTARYGYRYDTKTRTRVVCPDTAPIVQRIFAELAAGKSVRAVALSLDADKVPTPTGKYRWVHKTIRGLVRDASYHGAALRVGKATEMEGRYKNGRKRWRENPEGDRTVGGPTPAIVTKRVWDAANRQVADRSKAPIRVDHWLNTRVVCQCGFGMTRRKHRVGYSYWRCNGYVTHRCPQRNGHFHGDRVEEYVASRLLPLISNPAVREAKLRELGEQIASPEWESEGAKNDAEIARLEAKVRKLLDRFGDDPEMDSLLAEQVDTLKGQIASRRAITAALAGRMDAARRAKEVVDTARDLLSRWDQLDLLTKPEIWDGFSHADKRLVAEAVGLRVTCGREAPDGTPCERVVIVEAFADDLGWLQVGNRLCPDGTLWWPGESGANGSPVRGSQGTRDTRLAIAL